MKKAAAFVICLFVVVICFAQGKKEYSISYIDAALNLPTIIEKNLKLFEKEFAKDGYTLKFPHLFSAPDQVKALASGSIDAANCVGAIAVIAGISNGMDIKVLSMYSRAPKAFMLVTKDPKIKTIKDLKGKKISGPKGTPLHEMLGTALVKNKMSLNDIEHIQMNNDLSFAAFESGKVDAALLTGHAAQKALSNGARLIIDGQGLIGGEMFIIVSGKLYRENPDFAKRLIKVHKEAVNYLKTHKADAYKMAAHSGGLSIKEIEILADYYDFSPEFSPTDIKNLENTQKFLLENKMITNPVDLKTLF
ncbi:MAG: NrtA/SsuA/CpmA family ABC transporter substrate-binding protein [Elusimicrobiota bacterium]|jgi:sulfonate transport system substrate-binding protein|nr:NrtA/SsuA/CpmA family ABC transporter substrate-binding protein [Elusimicrobiota bacterium]